MKFLRTNLLLFVVFVTGACVLVIEVLAFRILSPYFGNTIFTTSSVIGVILTALSFGYYFGGKFADRRPENRVFYTIIIFSGLLTLVLLTSSLVFLPAYGYELSMRSGPLIFSIFLFLAPSFLLGTLSPFAIKLQKKMNPSAGVGKVSGEVFFASTFGSIFGSLFSGFYLIPKFGIDKILMGVSVTLLVVGYAGLISSKSTKIKIFVAVISLLLIASNLTIGKFMYGDSILYKDDGVYEQIIVLDTLRKDRPIRVLLQDRGSSSGVFLESEELVFVYVKYYELYKLMDHDIEDVLVIGGGAYTLPKVFVEGNPDVIVDVAEIEPELYEIAQKYFRVPNSERINNFKEDGRRFLHDSNKKYDLIFSDVYYSSSIPTHFTTKEFFELGRNGLKDNGLFIANIIGTLDNNPPNLLFSEYLTFSSVFENNYIFAVDSTTGNDTQNFILVGINGDKRLDLAKAEEVFTDTYMKSLENNILNIENYDFSDELVLTDNYAPVEIMTAKIKRD